MLMAYMRTYKQQTYVFIIFIIIKPSEYKNFAAFSGLSTLLV